MHLQPSGVSAKKAAHATIHRELQILGLQSSLPAGAAAAAAAATDKRQTRAELAGSQRQTRGAAAAALPPPQPPKRQQQQQQLQHLQVKHRGSAAVKAWRRQQQHQQACGDAGAPPAQRRRRVHLSEVTVEGETFRVGGSVYLVLDTQLLGGGGGDRALRCASRLQRGICASAIAAISCCEGVPT